MLTFAKDITGVVKNFLKNACEKCKIPKEASVMRYVEESPGYGYYVPDKYNVVFKRGELPQMMFEDRSLVNSINASLFGKSSFGFNLATVATVVDIMNTSEIQEWLIKHDYIIKYPDSPFNDANIKGKYIFSDIVDIEDTSIIDKMWSNTIEGILKYPQKKSTFIQCVEGLFELNLYEAIYMINCAANVTFQDIMEADGIYDNSRGGKKYYKYNSAELDAFYEVLFKAGVDAMPFIVCRFVDLSWTGFAKNREVMGWASMRLWFGPYERYSGDIKTAHHVDIHVLINYLRRATRSLESSTLPLDPEWYYDATYSKYETTEEHKALAREMLRYAYTDLTNPRCISPFMDNMHNVLFVYDFFGYVSDGLMPAKLQEKFPICMICRPTDMYSKQYKIAKKRREGGTRSSSPEYTENFGRQLDFTDSLYRLIDIYNKEFNPELKKTYMIFWMQEILISLYLGNDDWTDRFKSMTGLMERHPCLLTTDIIPALYFGNTLYEYAAAYVSNGADSKLVKSVEDHKAHNAYTLMLTYNPDADAYEYIHNFLALFAYEYDTGERKNSVGEYEFYSTLADARLMKYYTVGLFKCDQKMITFETNRKLMENVHNRNTRYGASTIKLNTKLFSDLYSVAISPMLSCRPGVQEHNAVIKPSDLIKGVDLIDATVTSDNAEASIEQKRIENENSIILANLCYDAMGVLKK